MVQTVPDYRSKDAAPGGTNHALYNTATCLLAVGLVLFLGYVGTPPVWRNDVVGEWLLYGFGVSVVFSAIGLVVSIVSLALRKTGWLPFALNSLLLIACACLVMSFMRIRHFPGG